MSVRQLKYITNTKLTSEAVINPKPLATSKNLTLPVNFISKSIPMLRLGSKSIIKNSTTSVPKCIVKERPSEPSRWGKCWRQRNKCQNYQDDKLHLWRVNRKYYEHLLMVCQSQNHCYIYLYMRYNCRIFFNLLAVVVFCFSSFHKRSIGTYFHSVYSSILVDI